MKRSELVVTYLTSSIFVAVLGMASPTMAGQDPKPDPKAAAQQRSLDLEHDMVQTDGVNHPRETVKTPGDKKAPQKPATKKTQRDLDLEHDMVQTDGVNHPRQKVTDKTAPPASNASAPTRKTQADLDQEHERLQSDGTYHPREVIKK